LGNMPPNPRSLISAVWRVVEKRQIGGPTGTIGHKVLEKRRKGGGGSSLTMFEK